MRRQSAMRGDFRYERKAGGWMVYRRGDGEPLGFALNQNKTHWPWYGKRAGAIVCPNFPTREQVAYCLDQKRREEDA